MASWQSYFSLGPLPLWGSVPLLLKEVVGPGRLGILPGGLSSGAQQLGGLLPGHSPLPFLSSCLQEMWPGWGNLCL